FSTAALALGTHSITAVYSGDVVDTAAGSAAVSQSVKGSTTTSLTSSPNPSTFGNAVTLTATVMPANTTGTVQFFKGAALLGSATLSGGTATLSTMALAAGANSLTATYTGNATSLASTSSVRTQTVNKANSSTTFAS